MERGGIVRELDKRQQLENASDRDILFAVLEMLESQDARLKKVEEYMDCSRDTWMWVRRTLIGSILATAGTCLALALWHGIPAALEKSTSAVEASPEETADNP